MASSKIFGESPTWKNIFSSRIIPKGSTEELLSRVPAFAELSLRELQEVAQIVHKREYRTGEPVFYEGDPGLGMYIIQNGKVSISLADADGDEKELALLSEGDFFGEIALLDESPRSATAMCTTECLLIGFFRPDLFEIIEKNTALGVKIVLKLAEIVAQRLRTTDQVISRLKSELNAIASGREKKSHDHEKKRKEKKHPTG